MCPTKPLSKMKSEICCYIQIGHVLKTEPSIRQYYTRQWNNYTWIPHLPSALAITMATTDANLHTKIFVIVNWTLAARCCYPR